MTNIIDQQIYEHGGIEGYLHAQQRKILLNFLTCGSVDDGKSTLVGRLLHDSKQICEDQLSVLYEDSKRIGTRKKNQLDLALLVDGLQSEREQGITIDVAYRYFFTQKRKFIIADTPGHEEYTKNMATGASTSDVAVLLVDARKGIRKQTKRHFLISTLLGIRYIIVVINKMDLINYDQIIFKKICNEYLECTKLFFNNDNINTEFIPVVASEGDNIVIPSVNMKWYDGPTLLDMLENVQINPIVNVESQKVRVPIQYVIRNHLDFRGYSGTIASGKIYVEQKIRIFPSNTTSMIQRIIISGKDEKCAWPGDAVTVLLLDNVNIGRGDILIDAHEDVEFTKCALVDIVWMGHQALRKDQCFYVKIANKMLTARVESIQYQINMDTLIQQETDEILLNGIGLVKLVFNEPMILDQYLCYPVTGSMIFIDFLTNETVGAGMVKKSIKNYPFESNKENHSEFELALYNLIRHHFPHWKVHDLS